MRRSLSTPTFSLLAALAFACFVALPVTTPATAPAVPATSPAAPAAVPPTSALPLQAQITTPEQQFGFALGADYHLANYQQLMEYWRLLERQSDRMVVEEIGTTAEGRPMLMAIITSPANHRDLNRYQEISRRLALAEGVSEEEARELAVEGKTVVWIDGGLHATEVLGAQQLMELVYQMVSRTDAEVTRILDDVILLAVCVNPDGLDLVADWYMRNPVPEQRSTRNLPRLYHQYVGHDNNRDFYMSAMPESEAINRILYREWFPQIVYNHHQSGPAGTVLFAPPFRDPFNYNLDPLVILGIERVGNAMHTRFVAEDKPGATNRSGASYSTWWNGGLRTTPYWHNMIGLLTETVGSPNPSEIPFILRRQLPSSDLPDPIAPQRWHFRQSVEYSLTANYAVLDIASKLREDFLFNIWRMGMNSIERGRRDHWTRTPARIAAVEAALEEREGSGRGAGPSGRGGGRGGFRGGDAGPDIGMYEEVFLDPEARDPRAYILPADQPDFLTAIKFANTLVKSGVAIHRASREFTVKGRSYPAGSLVVKADQAFRPMVLDMFEPQVHPDDFPYPGGPPTPPYDVAGWTLALQMGVEFDRVLEGFDGPFEKLEGFVGVPAGRVTGAGDATGFLVDHRANDAFVAVNRLLAAGDEVSWLAAEASAADRSWPAGTMYVAAGSGTLGRLQEIAREVGLEFVGVSSAPGVDRYRLGPVRVGLWDEYGGSMPSGWTRWLLEQFQFPFEVVYPPRLDAGNLNADFDVLVFNTGAIPASDGQGGGRGGRGGGPDPAQVPAEYRDRLGEVTVSRTVPRLRDFLENGGTIIAIGSSTALAEHLGLPISDHMVEKMPDGTVLPLPREKYYVPGSVLEVSVDNSQPLAWGLPERADVFFRNNPVFRLEPDAQARGVTPIAWFGPDALRSGWAWGETYLDDGVAVVAARVGTGNLFLFGPEIQFRAQPHGTFKLLFNGIYLSTAEGIEADQR